MSTSNKRFVGLEIGNSRAHLAEMEEGKIISRLDVSLQGDQVMGRILDWLVTRNQTSARLLWASVVPKKSQEFREAIRGKWSKPIDEIRTENSRFSFEIPHPEPARLGVDRALACEGAVRAGFTQTSLIVQTGTALTIDALVPSASGLRLEGGAIAPGTEMSFASLHEKTALLPEVRPDLRVEPKFFARSPEAAIQAGVWGGQAAMVYGFFMELSEQSTSGPIKHLVLTGGNSVSLLPWVRARFRSTSVSIQEVPDLVLLGLGSIHERLG